MSKNKGFTLIEIMIVIAIIGIIAALILVAIGSSRDKAVDSKTVSATDDVKSAVEMYYSSNGTFPSTLDEAGMQKYFNSEIPDNINYLVNGARTCYVLQTELEMGSDSVLLDKTGQIDDATACGEAGFNCANNQGFYCLIGTSS